MRLGTELARVCSETARNPVELPNAGPDQDGHDRRRVPRLGAGHPGRYELFKGDVFAMSPEGARHAEVKFAIQTALDKSIRARGPPCQMLTDGMMVRVNDDTAYEPDALVYCGPKISPTALEVPNPVILVEMLSPSTRHIEAARKLGDYFRLPSVAHYLIVDPLRPLILNHARAATSDTVLTHIITEGAITLDPPGVTLAVADIHGDTDV